MECFLLTNITTYVVNSKETTMRKTMHIVIVALGLCAAGISEAKTVRATEMTSSLWSKLTAGTADELIVEFRHGDQLPVSITAKGDFLETAQAGVTYVNVRRNFWLKLQNNDVQMSIDGSTFKPIKDVVGGMLTAGANAEESGGIANAINIALEAYLK
jgi:hypothetical protein